MIEPQLSFNRRWFEWSLDNAEAAIALRSFEQATGWLSFACECASSHAPTGFLSSTRVEQMLRRLSKELLAEQPTAREYPPRRFLHVVTEVYPIFGHSALLRRWISLDRSGAIHHVVATSQEKPFPQALSAEVAAAGGEVLLLDRQTSDLARAGELRHIAARRADVVILHSHPYDVIAPMAFCEPGGPPVLICNHADHIFWPGSSVADVIVNIRPSGQAASERCRGLVRNVILPVPLGDDLRVARDDGSKAVARKSLGIAIEAIVFLSIGQAYKYRPVGHLDFFVAAGELLDRCPLAIVVVVGPSAADIPAAVAVRWPGRLLAVGTKQDLRHYYAAADVYLEGFPIGSLTALLEAAMNGIPCILAPREIPDLLTCDDVALECVSRPANVADYIACATALGAGDRSKRVAAGIAMSASTAAWHGGAGWLAQLASLTRDIPREHRPIEALEPSPLPADTSALWQQVVGAEPRVTFDRSKKIILMRLLQPIARFDRELWTLWNEDRWMSRLSRRLPWIADLGAWSLFRSLQSERLAESASRLWRAGENAAARREALAALMTHPTSIGQSRLWNIVVKSLLGARLLGKIRALRAGRAKRRTVENLPNPSDSIVATARAWAKNVCRW